MKIRKWQPRVEALESRWVPALLLTLDGAGNLTTIFGVPDGTVDLTFTADDEVNVVEDGNDLGTYAVSGNLRVSLGNSLALVDVNVDFGGNAMSGSLSVAAGNSLGGYDISVVDGEVDGNLSISSGSGDDIFAVTNMTVGGLVRMSGGGGVDDGTIENSTTEDSVTVTDVETFLLTESDVLGNFSYTTRGGAASTLELDADSTVEGSVFVRTGAGADNADIAAAVLGNVIAQQGGGDDGFNVALSSVLNVLGSLFVGGGGGNDILFVIGDVAGNVVFTGGGGNDSAIFGDIAPATVLGNAITLVMGNGDDSMIVGPDTLTAPGARLTFLGGNGNDTVDWSTSPTNPDLASAYLDGGFGTNDFIPNAAAIDFPFTLRNFV